MKTACPFCDQTYNVGDENLHQKATCAKCGKDFVMEAIKPLVTSFCPFCRQKYKIAPEQRNQEMICDKCGNAFQMIPAVNEQEPNIFSGEQTDKKTSTESVADRAAFWVSAIINIVWLLFGGWILLGGMIQVIHDPSSNIFWSFMMVVISYIIYMFINLLLIRSCKKNSVLLTAKVLYWVYRGGFLFCTGKMVFLFICCLPLPELHFFHFGTFGIWLIVYLFTGLPFRKLGEACRS